ncbi:MAG: hypothetical protein ACTSVU_09640 [Promethearchaeota archaeon]
MQNVDENTLNIIKNLPNNASYDDIMESIYINHKIDFGIEQFGKENSLIIEILR